MLEAPKRALKFAANDAWGKLYTSNNTVPMTQGLSVLTGMSAGATESIIVTPFEGVKILVRSPPSVERKKRVADVVLWMIQLQDKNST